MKNKLLYCIILLIITISVSYLFLKFQKTTLSKPKLITKIINQGESFSIPNGSNPTILLGALNDIYDIVIDQNTENYDLIIDGPYGDTPIANARAVKVYSTFEATVPDPEKYDLYIGFNFIESPNYLRIPLYYFYYYGDVSTKYTREVNCNPNKEYFTCFISSNWGYNSGVNYLNNLPFDGCYKRNRLFHLLSLYKNVQSGGKFLNNIGGPIPYEPDRQVKGPLAFDQTKEWLSSCKFVIAYEN